MGLVSLLHEGDVHVSCWVGSSCSGMSGQTFHGGTTCFQHALLAPASLAVCTSHLGQLPAAFRLSPAPTSEPLGLPSCLWQLLLKAGLGSHLCPVALGPDLHWLSPWAYRTKAMSLAHLRGSLGCQDKHFLFPLPLCRLDGDLYFPKALEGGEEGQRVAPSPKRGIATKKHKQRM